MPILPPVNPVINCVTLEKPLIVKIERDIPLPWFLFTFEDESSEEFEPEEAREFFRIRGANMDNVEKAFDYVWNFGKTKPVSIMVEHPRPIPRKDKNQLPPSIAPKI